MDLLLSFQAFIKRHHLLDPNERVLVAVSGGVDSVVLAHLFRESEIAYGIACCNFQLRGAESDAEEAFVRQLAKAWRAPCYTERFDTAAYAAQTGLSIQVAARLQRYAWFERLRAEHGYTALATGHHLDDSVETGLLNYIRGTGLTGLGGIPLRNGDTIRPLLFATRAAILHYARQQQLQWREDSSNASDDYTRNAIRHHLIPRMQEINPTFVDVAAHTQRHLRAADRNLQFLLQAHLMRSAGRHLHRIDKAAAASLPAMTDGLFELLQPYGFTADQVRQLSDNWSQTGAEWYSTLGWRLLNDRGELLLSKGNPEPEPLAIAEDDLMVRLPDDSRLLLTPALPGSPPPEDASTAIVDAETLQFPLLLRRWRPGDAFQPLGMEGRHQKLQDLFVNRKLSRLEKDNTWILENGDGRIIWVVGLRQDERFKLTSESSKLLKISWVRDL